jgi:hypothetical protein
MARQGAPVPPLMIEGDKAERQLLLFAVSFGLLSGSDLLVHSL